MVLTVPVNRQTIPRAQREAEILRAAAREFAITGFDDTTMAVIARRAGMTSANVHYYFPSKDALVAAVAAQAYALLFAELAELPDPVERLHRYVAFHLESHALRGQLQAIAVRSPELADVLRWRETWVAGEAGALAPDPLDADALAAVVTGLIEIVSPHPDPWAVLDHALARLVPIPTRSTR